MTIFEAYNNTKKKLEAAGIEDYIFEAKQIIKHITGLNAAQILSKYNNKLTQFQEDNLTVIVRQREIRYPLQYIFGEWDFYGRSFDVGVGVLVPRADTEAIVEACLEYLKDKKNPEILDLCAGSGCIGITLAAEKTDSKVLLLEKYDEALRFAVRNIEKNDLSNVTAHNGDIFNGDCSDKKYDLIVSNPPYIPQSEWNLVSPETEFEPKTALLAEDGGMEFYKAIIDNYKNSLKEGGMLCFEVGINGSETVADLLKCAGFCDITFKKDLNEIVRAVSGIKIQESRE